MQIKSTNIGDPKTIKWNGKVIKTGIFKYAVNEPIYLDSDDVLNDHVIDRRYHGGVDKACYIYSTDHYKYWQKLYPELEMSWGMFGENLSVKGLHETEVNIGDIYKIGKAVVQATQPRQPCFKLEFRFHDKEIVQQFIDSGFSGVYVRVLEKGIVNVGDSMKLIEKKDSLSIQKVYEFIYASEFDPEIRKAVNDPHLAESCRKDLLKLWGEYL